VPGIFSGLLKNVPLPEPSQADVVGRMIEKGNLNLKRTGDIEQMRADIFEALYRHIEGYTGKELRDALHEFNGVVGLVLADAVVEGELIAKKIEDSRPPDRRYRLSYSKWLEMVEAHAAR
jgi:hypothetical protein